MLFRVNLLLLCLNCYNLSFLYSLSRFWTFDEFIWLIDSWILGQGNIQLSAELSESAIAVIEDIQLRDPVAPGLLLVDYYKSFVIIVPSLLCDLVGV